ncbi:MAG: cytochrome c1 [Gammaproteobacteria bacterium]|nr:cytochrome c1 [Gammaproteobacteria bacterium]MBU1480828.1 cytochrome c1 [Gammaproteobacteria bacterium]
MKLINKLWMLVLLMVPAMAFASETLHLDAAPGSLSDKASLQRGAQFFVANCLACHSAAYMRYNRLADIGMSDEEIRKLLPEGGKPGSTMKAAMDSETAKAAFGAAPPDMSVEVRARGADWVYTYLRSFYVDTERSSGVNNLLFPLVAMPNILGTLQGDQALEVVKHEGGHEVQTLKLTSPGSMSPKEFDATVGDLVNFLDFMSEPAKLVRYKLGYIVLGFLFILLILAYLLKKEFWKDIH